MTDEQPPASVTDEQPQQQHWSRRPFVGPFSARQVTALVASLVITGFVLVALTTPLAGRPDPSLPVPGSGFVEVGPRSEGLHVGDRAPELEGEFGGVQIQLQDLDGKPVRLAELRGKPVWINFWATWCPPCQEETPVLRDVYEKYRDDGLELVAISVQETTIDDVRRYVELYELQYTVGFDATSAIFHTYRAFGLPTQLFLDREGLIREVVLGPVTRERAEAIIEPLLAE